MKLVYTAQHPAEAHFVKGLLMSNGIGCEVRGESLWGTRGMVPITTETAPSVWLFEDSDYDSAKQVVTEYEKNISEYSSDEENWTCRSCGEESEGQFAECWNCGTKRPGEDADSVNRGS
ncbi:MAG: DUF2007 domain-containing protein [Desulfobacteraceae bacterium]